MLSAKTFIRRSQGTNGYCVRNTGYFSIVGWDRPIARIRLTKYLMCIYGYIATSFCRCVWKKSADRMYFSACVTLLTITWTYTKRTQNVCMFFAASGWNNWHIVFQTYRNKNCERVYERDRGEKSCRALNPLFHSALSMMADVIND